MPVFYLAPGGTPPRPPLTNDPRRGLFLLTLPLTSPVFEVEAERPSAFPPPSFPPLGEEQPCSISTPDARRTAPAPPAAPSSASAACPPSACRSAPSSASRRPCPPRSAAPLAASSFGCRAAPATTTASTPSP